MAPPAPTSSSRKLRSTSSRTQQQCSTKTEQALVKQSIPNNIIKTCPSQPDTTPLSSSKVIPSDTSKGNNNRKRPLVEDKVDTAESTTPLKFDLTKVIHDPAHYMFKLNLGTKGNIAALCYLPTKFSTVIEFYHTEVPSNWRHHGIGDLLVQRAFEWVKQSNLLVIPSCPFVLHYIKIHYPDRSNAFWKYIVDEKTQLDKFTSKK